MKTVLLVDDCKVHILMAKKYLQTMNLDVQIAKDGSQALQMIESNHNLYDLLLTDYNMPNMDGMELTLKLREKYSKEDFGIFVLSANEDPTLAQKFLEVGANDFLAKPYKKEQFVDKVNSAIAS